MYHITMMKVLLRVWQNFKDNTLKIDKTDLQIDDHVKAALKEHKNTLNFLEKHDKGEVPTPASVAKHRDLQSYLQSL